MRRLPIPLLCVLSLTAGCGREVPETETMARTAPVPSLPALPQQAPVAADRPVRKGWLGVVVARESVDVTADSQGRLLAVHVEIGDSVQRGDRVASLDTRLAVQDLEMARSSLRAAAADEKRSADELAEARARNERRQSNPDFFSKEDLAEAELREKTATAALEMARARVSEQRARVRQLDTGLGQSEIRAPFTGRVAERFVDPGAMIGPGTPVVRLISAGDLHIRAAVPPEEARKLAVGDPVTATVRAQNLRLPGTVERVAPEVDAASQLVFIEARLRPNPAAAGRLQTGLVVEVAKP